MFKLYCPNVYNFGDFLNCLPVVAGLYNAFGQIRFVVPDSLKMINGFRDFMLYQELFSEVLFRSEVIGMEENNYVITSYSQEEFRHLSEEMPIRPIETLRHEKFIRDYFPNIGDWVVDDNFILKVDLNKGIEYPGKYICGDRWLHKNTDTRRASFILQNSGKFNDVNRYHFLDYKDDVMVNAATIALGTKDFLGTYTGSSVIADLLNVRHIVFHADDMLDPPWNQAPIIYSYWKHYYRDRKSLYMHVKEWNDSGKVW